jgi:hypothetical protein
MDVLRIEAADHRGGRADEKQSGDTHEDRNLHRAFTIRKRFNLLLL